MMSPRGYRSLFWPIVLMGVGLTWLLGNLGILPWNNIYSLVRLWPLILVIIGLDLLFGRRSTLGSAVIGLVTVGLIITFLVFGSSLGLVQTRALITTNYHAAVSQATSAAINLDLSSAQTSVFALADSPDIINARIDHVGQVNFVVSGETQKSIRLYETNFGVNWLDPQNWGSAMRWEIGLSPRLPISLEINVASGSGSLDLSKINLSGLKIDAASGSVSVVLPKTGSHYQVDINGASGSISLTAACSDTEIRLDGASGSQTINLPQGCPVRIDVRDTGSGSINLPVNLTHTTSSSGNRKTGVWETAGFSSAAPGVMVTITSAGSGCINIH